MDRSIDLLEGIARATDDRIILNRRGYFSRDAPRLAETIRNGSVSRDPFRKPVAQRASQP